MPTKSETFHAHTAHQDARDPQPFEDAALLLEAGATVEDAYAILSEQHKSALFRMTNKPPLPVLAAHEDPAAMLRECAAKLKDE